MGSNPTGGYTESASTKGTYVADRSTERARKRITAISSEIALLRSRMAILQEQIDFLVHVESDAKVQAVVSDNAAQAREHRAAKDDLQRARRERDEVHADLSRRRAEQDQLLDGLLD